MGAGKDTEPVKQIYDNGSKEPGDRPFLEGASEKSHRLPQHWLPFLQKLTSAVNQYPHKNINIMRP